MLEQMGYKIDHKLIHLMGLSNGGSAISAAMHSRHARDFKSITTISCNLGELRRVPCQVNLIGGGMDNSASRMPSQHRSLRNMGVDAEIFFDAEENHYIMVNRREEIISAQELRSKISIKGSRRRSLTASRKTSSSGRAPDSLP